METLLGIKGPDFVMLAADTTHAHSVIVMKEGKTRRQVAKGVQYTGSGANIICIYFKMRTRSIRLRITC